MIREPGSKSRAAGLSSGHSGETPRGHLAKLEGTANYFFAAFFFLDFFFMAMIVILCVVCCRR
jgi:hypothetical protein